jgi:ADP-ribose pyrophosphatase YjhB (NUDIX family)
LDVPSRPEFTTVIPGGGIEQGERVEEAALREAKEETGLDVVFVRELGVAENPGQTDPSFLHEAHYVHAKAPARLPDTWEHRVTGHGAEEGQPVVCRWIPVREGAEVWGLRGRFIGSLVRERVVGYVTRTREGRLELLTITYADGPFEVPAGRLDRGESLEDGLAREVEEEAGLTAIGIVSMLADADEFARLYGPGAHRSYAFHAESDDERETWEHVISGDGADSGLTHLCRWVPLDDCPPLWGKPDPLVEKLRRSISKE